MDQKIRELLGKLVFTLEALTMETSQNNWYDPDTYTFSYRAGDRIWYELVKELDEVRALLNKGE